MGQKARRRSETNAVGAKGQGSQLMGLPLASVRKFEHRKKKKMIVADYMLNEYLNDVNVEREGRRDRFFLLLHCYLIHVETMTE